MALRRTRDTLTTGARAESSPRHFAVHGAVPAAIVSLDGSVVDCNDALANCLGRAARTLLGIDVADLVSPADRDEVAAMFDTVSHGPLPQRSFDVRLAAQDGPRWGRLHMTRADDQRWVLCQIVDTTDIRRAQTMLSAEARILEQIASDTPVSDALGSVLRLAADQLDCVEAAVHGVDSESSELVHLAGFETAPTLRTGLDARVVSAGVAPFGPVVVHGAPVFVPDVAADPLWAPDADLLESSGVSAVWSVPVNGSSRHQPLGTLTLCWSEPRPVDDEARAVVELCAHLAGVALERHAALRERSHGVSTDQLTDLPTRAVFVDRLANALARSERRPTIVGVLVLALGRLDVVNDTFGVGAIDRILTDLAVRLNATLRPGDTLTRLSGDQFALLCDDLSGPVDAVAIGRRLAELTTRPFRLDGGEVALTANVGVATSDDRPDGTLRERSHGLLHDAETAVRAASLRGEGSITVYDAELRATVLQRLERQQQLHRAVMEQDLWVAYQPLVSLTTGGVEGFEALARWDLNGTAVPPAEFIPMAEESGLISAIGELVLRQALLDVARLRTSHAHRDLVMAVNLSPRQLEDADLVGMVRSALDDAGVEPSALRLEITETVLVDDNELFLAQLCQLRDLGVRLAVDDFGTGYSSLTYLQRFPVTTLKVDRAFVAGLGVTKDADAIVTAVVNLAHSLELDVVAEGVEDHSQQVLLTSLGCEQGQGYLFSPPVPIDAAEQLLSRRRLTVPTVPAPLRVV